MSADLDNLLRPADDFEWRLFHVEQIFALIEAALATDRQLIRALADQLAEDDEEFAPTYRKMTNPVDLSASITDAFKFLHSMHEQYVAERQAVAAGRVLFSREAEHARAARSVLVRLAFRKGRVSTGE